MTIKLRVLTSDRELIDRAARVQGKSRSEFMLEAAREKARQVLVEQTFVQLDPRAFQRFSELLDSPLEPSGKLAALLKREAPWLK